MPTITRRSWLRGTRVALGAGFLATAVTACGASATGGPVGATTATGNASPIGLSRCMRANGLPDFPDPTMGPGGEGFNGVGIVAGGGLIVDGKNFSGPAATRAQRACARFLPSGSPPQLSEAQKQRLLALARCMRRHGLPSFPDPQFPAPGAGPPRQPPAAGQSLDAPAARAALQACGRAGGQISVGP